MDVVCREKDIEKWLKEKIERAGGLAFKFVSPGSTGVPDRLVILPGGRVHFLELKSETGRLSSLQIWQIGRLKKLGCDVRVIRGISDAKRWWKEVMPDEVHTARLSEASD